MCRVIINGHHLDPNGQGAELSRKWEENGYWPPEINTCVTDLERFGKNSIISFSGLQKSNINSSPNINISDSLPKSSCCLLV